MQNLTADLEAVNIMLSVIGESPVNAIVGTTADASIASNILKEVSREVQSRGWLSNTEWDVPLLRDTDGRIPLPANCLRVSIDPVHRTADVTPVQRGSWLYDTQNRSYVFKRDLKARVVYLLDFTDLPEVLRRYVTIRAARVFQDRMMGAETTHAYTAADEQQALYLALNSENITNHMSVLENAEISGWRSRSL